jgi:Rad3-related DNA helicase
LEIDCKYSNFSSGKFSRGDYLRSLSKCIESAKKPVLVHVNGFVDLPTEQELEEFDVDNLVSRERLIELQGKDKNDQVVERFKKGQIEVLFTTKCARGIDFPGEQCNSIVFTKYPNPNVKDSFWKILNRTQPQHYWQFYKDKARRELLQKVYRGLRSRDDHVYVLSPDSRVLDYFEN